MCVSCAHVEKTSKNPAMLADMEPFSLVVINASVEQSFSSKLKAVDVDVVFHPRKNEVVLEFQHGASYYQQVWDQAGRERFIEAINRYKEDFANKKLITNYNKTQSIYGKVSGRFQWKPLKISQTYRSSPVIVLGYRFRDDAPYFSVFQKIAAEETKNNKEGITQSPQYSVYFTRAQGDEIAYLFDQDFLIRSLGYNPPSAAADPAKDVYIAK